MTGYEFYRLTTRKDSLLYSTIFVTKKIHAYDIATGNLKYRFEVTTGEARGLAFDPRGYLHVTTGSNVVETFTYKGSKKEPKVYPELQVGEGILIDSKQNMIIVDLAYTQVLVYSRAGLLTKRITGFNIYQSMLPWVTNVII